MKKLSILIFAMFAFAISSVTLAQTQNLGDLIDSLGTEITFGYNSNQKVSVKEVTSEKIVFQSPIIKNQGGANITKYTIMYSEFPLTDILEKTDLLNQTKEKAFELTGNTDPFVMELGTIDNIDPTKKYYIFVIPKDTNGTLGEVSNEIWFKLADKVYGEGNTTGSTATLATTTHAAAGADMTLAGITHTLQGNLITLKWMPVDGSSNVDILLMDTNTNSFNRLSTVNMNAGSYNYTANRNGEFIFQFIPDNGGRQVNYTVTMNGLQGVTPSNPNGPVINKVPKTGPAENIIAILIIATISYFLYKKFYKKAK